jgi:hypothetical protein
VPTYSRGKTQSLLLTERRGKEGKGKEGKEKKGKGGRYLVFFLLASEQNRTAPLIELVVLIFEGNTLQHRDQASRIVRT